MPEGGKTMGFVTAASVKETKEDNERVNGSIQKTGRSSMQ